ncbi:hypothetical protein Y032_0005g2317 [Ancylostoma ceylanicum]|uniref:Uncharacterized protein n=1 Tax=Ancylostoma ceylanicum TaxID=53326 RepID=A0A016VR41_9BILA|nr:hypothetical protein Y032_0005g2317 [Ancylostoma ceylanicum]
MQGRDVEENRAAVPTLVCGHLELTIYQMRLLGARIHLRRIFDEDRSTRHGILNEKKVRSPRGRKRVRCHANAMRLVPILHHIVARASVARIQYKLPLTQPYLYTTAYGTFLDNIQSFQKILASGIHRPSAEPRRPPMH